MIKFSNLLKILASSRDTLEIYFNKIYKNIVKKEK